RRAPHQPRAGGRARRRAARRAVRPAGARVDVRPGRRRRGPRGRRPLDRAAGPAHGQGAGVIALLAQLKIGHRAAPGCVENNGFCPSWIADNLHRYWKPLLEHIELTLVSVAIGFAIAFALGVLAHRRRWLVGPITQITGVLYTLPSIALFFLP